MGASSATSVPGSTTRLPSGFASSLAILAMNFEVATPTDAVSPSVASVIEAGARRRPAAGWRVVARHRLRGPQVDEGLVEAQGLHQRGERPQPVHHLCARLAVGVEAAAEEAACGQRRRASPPGMADFTPNTRAS
jgi:hypothetical protein